MKTTIKLLTVILPILIASCSSVGYIQTADTKIVLPTALAGDQSFDNFSLRSPQGVEVAFSGYKTVNPNTTLTKSAATVGGLHIGASVTKALSGDHVKVVNSNNNAAVETIKAKGAAEALVKGTPNPNAEQFLPVAPTE